ESLIGRQQMLAMLVMVVAVLGSCYVSEAKCDYQAIFNFGDSNSDTGGFWAAFPSQPGPNGMTYFKRPSGRASDGRLVIDFLAQAIGQPFVSPYLQSIGSNYQHGANFATLASTVLLPKTSLFESGLSPFALPVQLNQMKDFKARVLEQSSSSGTFFFSGGYLPPSDIFGNALYTLHIGQNDFTSNLPSVGLGGIKDISWQVVSKIDETVKELYNLGGRTILVFNLAPIGCFPMFISQLPHQSNDFDQSGCMMSYNNAVVEYNNMLKGTLQHTREGLGDASIIYVDLYSIYLELFRAPQNHGLTYGPKACCGVGGGDYNYNPEVFCGNTKVVNGKSLTATACSDPQNYISWDGIHATEAANKQITSAILSGSYFDPPFALNQRCDIQQIG
ncbi:hypothetical protein GIB67_008208, partial [Kingdonia uniflora]